MLLHASVRHPLSLAEDGGAGVRCLAHAEAAMALLQTEGWEACPQRHELTGGLPGPPHEEAGLGD